MDVNVTLEQSIRKAPRRFITLDFARGIAIFLMLILHIIHGVLNIDLLMSETVINGQPIIALSAIDFLTIFRRISRFFPSSFICKQYD